MTVSLKDLVSFCPLCVLSVSKGFISLDIVDYVRVPRICVTIFESGKN